jgi:hypothetical protein
MIANFFQSLSRHNAEYLLINGQAAVLYGAATFSEDIDLWIEPSAENRNRFLAALRDCHARYYKLTPQFTVENLRRGHGFHFMLPVDREEDVFLDVMGAPPRAGSFTSALASARWMATEWGPVRTVGVKTLVELKKTQRLEDYPIVSRLSLAWFDQPECGKAEDDFRWAFRNIFTVPELRMFFEEQTGIPETLVAELSPDMREIARQARVGDEIADETANRVNGDLQRRIAELQQLDRRYWRDIIADLKQLRAEGKLIPEGAEV